MPVITGSVSVAANATSANVLAGQLFEFLPAGATVTLLATGSATGLNASLLIAGVSVISDNLIGAQNRIPIIPDDYLVRTRGNKGDRLFLTFRNTTGGALTAFYMVQINAPGSR